MRGDRPQFAAALTALRPGDTLLFWKSDRWGRSAAHMLTVVNALRERGVTVMSLTENFDLATKEGRFVFTFAGWLLAAVVAAGLTGVFKRD